MTQTTTSTAFAIRVRDLLLNRQTEFESFLQTLVETESPSGDEVGSRAVVELLTQAASKLRCVDSIESIDVPGFGQHLLIKAFATNGARDQAHA